MSEVDFSKEAKEFLRVQETRSQNSSFVVKLRKLLNSKAHDHNKLYDIKVSFDILKEVYKRGSEASVLNHQPDKTRSQAAICRVNTFLKFIRQSIVPDSYSLFDIDLASKCENFPELPLKLPKLIENINFWEFTDEEFALAHVDLVSFNINKSEQDEDDQRLYFSLEELQTLNKPFQIPHEFSENPADYVEFGVFVKPLGKDETILVKFENRLVRASSKTLENTDPMYWTSKFWKKNPINKFISSEALEWDEDCIFSEWVWQPTNIISLDKLLSINSELKNILKWTKNQQ